MKTPIFLSTLLLMLFTFTVYAQNKITPNPNGSKDEAVVRSYMEAVLSRDPAKLERNHADGYMGYGPRWNSSETKADMIRNIKTIWDGFTDISYDRVRLASMTVTGDEETLLNGNWVFSWSIFKGKDKISGKEISIDVHQTYKIENGKIVLSTVYYNQLDYLIQSGQYTGN